MFGKMIHKSVLAAVLTVGFTGFSAVAQSLPANQQDQQQQPQTPAAGSLLQGAQQQRNQFYTYALAPSFKPAINSRNEFFVVSTERHAMYGVMGWRGLRTVNNMQGLTQLCFKCLTGDAHMQNFRVVSNQPAKPANGFARAIDFQFTFDVNGGKSCQGEAIVHGGPAGNGLMIGAMQFFATTTDQFQQVRPELAQLAVSVGPSSPQTFGTNANTRVSRPGAGGASPVSSGPAVSGDAGGSQSPDAETSFERNSRHQQENMLGFDTVHDDNGTTYQPDWSLYNKQAGGYVDPNDPTKVLSAGPASDPEN